MTDVKDLITDNIDIWTSAIKKRNATGRGSSKKIELTGVKKLRELILELAVRGKLVPQDANDEPASVLLDKIAQEKAQLVADKKIKKSKPLPELSIDEVSFELPIGWAIAYIPEVISFDKYAIKRGPFGSSLKKSFFVPKGIKVYEQQHAIRDDFSLGEYYITDEKFDELSAFEIKPNDLIISCSGTVGKVAVAPDWMEKGIINQALLKITLNQSALTNAYFKILFTAFYMQTDTLNDLQGTAQKNMVSVDTLKSEPFPLPSIAEQHRIVAKVDELMALCDQLEQQTEQSLTAHKTLVEELLNALFKSSDSTSATTADSESDYTAHFQESWARIADHFDILFTTEHSIEQLKQTILQLAVMGKLVPQNPADEPIEQLIDKLYGEQCARKLSSKEKLVVEQEYENSKSTINNNVALIKARFICDFITKGTTPSKPDLLESGEVPFLKVYNIVKNQLDFAYKPIFITAETNTGKLKRSRVFPNDVIMNIVGPPLGKVAVITDEYPEWNMNQALAVFRPLAGIDSQYLYYMLPTDAVLASVLKEVKGTAGQDNLSLEQCRDLLIPIPSIKQQRIIVKLIEDLMTLCDQLKARLSDAQTTQLHLADAVVEQALT